MGIKKKSGKERMLSKYIKAPIKLLRRAMSLYINSTEHVSFGAAPIGFPTGALVRSLSVGSRNGGNNDSYRAEAEVLRSASTNNSNSNNLRMMSWNKIEDQTDLAQRKQGHDEEKSSGAKAASVGIGRIDEDKSCRFDIEIDNFKPNIPLLPRSRSHDVSKRSTSWIFNAMNREEKKRKFRDALLNTLYPPSSARSSLQEHNNDETPANPLPETFDVDLIPDDYGEQQSQSSSSESDDKSRPQKLSRAQRKRIRQKKLKEDASRRGRMVGPLTLLPPSSSSDEDGKSTPGVRQNANESQGETLGQGKIKQRRRAKKMTKEEKLLHSNMENSTRDCSMESSTNAENCDKNPI